MGDAPAENVANGTYDQEESFEEQRIHIVRTTWDKRLGNQGS